MDRSLGKWKLPQPTDLKDEEQKSGYRYHV